MMIGLAFLWKWLCALFVRIMCVTYRKTLIPHDAAEECEPQGKRRRDTSIPYWQRMNEKWMRAHARRMARRPKDSRDSFRRH